MIAILSRLLTNNFSEADLWELEELQTTWTIEYGQEDGIVRVKMTGRATLESLKRLATEALAEAARHGADKFLVDDREMVPNIGTMDIYNLPDILQKLGMNHAHKVAVVFSASSEKVEDFQFYEARANNLGFGHRLFTSPEAALDWLMDRNELS